jgi:hypothetical protein
MSHAWGLPMLIVCLAVSCGPSGANDFFGASARASSTGGVVAGGNGGSLAGARVGGAGGAEDTTAGGEGGGLISAGAGGDVSEGGASATGGTVVVGAGSAGSGGTGGSGGSTCQPHTWYADADGDGYGDPNSTEESCQPPEGYVSNADDCYDGNAEARPGPRPPFPPLEHEEDRRDAAVDGVRGVPRSSSLRHDRMVGDGGSWVRRSGAVEEQRRLVSGSADRRHPAVLVTFSRS